MRNEAVLRPLALTSGEPAGVGPEITALAWQALHAESQSAFFLIGDADYFSARARAAGLAVPTQHISNVEEARNVFAKALPVLHRPLPMHPTAGTFATITAEAVLASISEAVDLCLSGAAAGLVTNPIQKEALYKTGFAYQGHTDYLGALAKAAGYQASDVMMLMAQDLRAIPVTVHIPLRAVAGTLTTAMIVEQGGVVARALTQYFGIAAPRLAVTGLNPHAGENGTMGQEDHMIIAPAIAALKQLGISAFGPLPADTAFHAAARKTYDAILCMYHDQALIPAKTLDFYGGVNVTLGLPFIRTSPDHGTALNIAGNGSANPESLIAALRLARRMASNAGVGAS
jgi:4-hydroxythreonine-4-phosphate dehydrogenase